MFIDIEIIIPVFYKIRRSISNGNYTICAINARNNWHYISYYVRIYPFKNIISREIIIFTDVERIVINRALNFSSPNFIESLNRSNKSLESEEK